MLEGVRRALGRMQEIESRMSRLSAIGDSFKFQGMSGSGETSRATFTEVLKRASEPPAPDRISRDGKPATQIEDAVPGRSVSDATGSTAGLFEKRAMATGEQPARLASRAGAAARAAVSAAALGIGAADEFDSGGREAAGTFGVSEDAGSISAESSLAEVLAGISDVSADKGESAPQDPPRLSSGRIPGSRPLTGGRAGETVSLAARAIGRDLGADDIRRRIADAVQKNAGRFGIDPQLVMAVIDTESSFDPTLVSNKGAQGLMQLMPGTAGMLGVDDPFDIDQNVRGGTEYLSRMLDRFGDLEKALAAYNAGPGRVERYGGIPPFQETRRYVEKVMERYKKDDR